jgi:hypothetical protein
LERYQEEECNGRGIKVIKVTENLINCRENRPRIWGGNGLCRLQTVISGATSNKLGPGGLDGNMEERRIGWDNKCWLMLRKKVRK